MNSAVDDLLYPLLLIMSNSVSDLLTSLSNSVSDLLTALLSLLSITYHYIGHVTQLWFTSILPPINCAIAIFQKLAMDLPVYGWMALEKLGQLVQEIPEVARYATYYCL